MNVSLNWLKEYAPFDCDIHTFSEEMTMVGQKVEIFSTEADKCKNVVIGKILEIKEHPHADKLVVCMVDVGKEVLQICTGAKNLKVGDLVPVALDGSVLPCGKEIHNGQLRGVDSNGMLCSLSELGLTTHDFPNAVEDGIMVLDEEWPLGTDAVKALGMDDYSVEFEITPNRPDCLSVLGLAREAGAAFKVPFKMPDVEFPEGEGNINDLLKVTIHDTEHCQRYTAGMIKNVRVKPSPKWMRERLRMCGIRPINNIVDITNYVMMLYGHPMHAFDYKYVKGGHINVRPAKNGEEIITLDGVQRKLTDKMLVIADSEEPIGIAGIMGGEYSGVYDDTNMVVFESACFEGTNVRATSRALNHRTEASGKYEKGLNPEYCVPALQMALQLVKELDAGDIVNGHIDIYPQPRTERHVKFDVDKINKILGTQISRDEMEKILLSLDFGVKGDDITVPTHRYDIAKDKVTEMNDIAEEIARVYGYNKLPSTIMNGIAVAKPTEMQRFTKKVVNALLGFGFYEIETFSFYSPKNFDLLNIPQDSPLRKPVVISNPLGEDTSIMRTTAVASMMGVIARNYNARVQSVSLFENATEYLPVEGQDLPEEPRKFILGCYGEGRDFFFLKGVIEKLVWSLDISDIRFVRSDGAGTYHPGRCADVYIEGIKVATLGEIHPTVLTNYGIKTKVCVADIDSRRLFGRIKGVHQYVSLARFPAMTRDIAVVCDDAITNGEIMDIIKDSCADKLESVKLFDLYKGSHIEPGKKSMAYNIVLRDKQATLTDRIADECIRKILDNLAKINVFLRR